MPFFAAQAASLHPSFAVLLALLLQISLQQIATTDMPVGIVNAGDSRLFIVQQRGTIAVWDGTRILPTPFLDLRSAVSCCGERGLLGLAFHPHYANNGEFFVDYTDPSGAITIARYNVSPSNPNVADPASATILLTIPHSDFANHNGGSLQFGPDGYLYIGVGDGGSGGDPSNHAQDLSQLLGKILRLDVDAPPPYVPATNPFVSRAGARPEIWAYGVRNPWRITFDRATGDLWIADVGQDRYEEVDLQPSFSAGGDNYGWRLMEGFHCYNPPANCQIAGLTMPILEYDHGGGRCSISGGYRYRGAHYPRLSGIYLYADYCAGTIWGATQDAGGAWSSSVLLQTNLRISTFGEDVNGELYVADVAGGGIYALHDTVTERHRAARH